MTHLELQQATIGKEIVRTRDGKVITRTQAFFDYSSEEIRLALMGHEGIFMLRDKENWKDGEYHDPDKRKVGYIGGKNLYPVESDEQ